MPGSQANTSDVPDDNEAWLLAAAWGSYLRDGDPGACLYGFRAGGSPPASSGHRDECLNRLDQDLLPSARHRLADTLASSASGGVERVDIEDLQRLRTWLASWSDADLAQPWPVDPARPCILSRASVAS